MPTYKFVKRNSSTAAPELIAAYQFPSKIWLGDKETIRKMQDFIISLGIDLTSQQSLDQLPDRVSGSYFWVVKS